MSYRLELFGSVSEFQYKETTCTDAQCRRAKALIEGTACPVSGFERHFLLCVNGLATPLVPKERVLCEATANHQPRKSRSAAEIQIVRQPDDDWYALDDNNNYSPEDDLERDYADVIRQWWENIGQFVESPPRVLRKAAHDALNSDIIREQQECSDD